jgi:TonB family protein
MPRLSSILATLLILAATTVATAQAPPQAESLIGQAKALYANADYDGALAVLASAEAAGPSGVTYELHHYRALCLVALGRTEDAERAIAATLEANPTFSPASTDMSPRVQALFRDARERLLPQLARKRLTEARGVGRDGDPARALTAIDAALTLLNDPALVSRTDLDDLRLAAGTMRELTNAQVVTAAQAAQAAATAAAPPAPSGTPAAMAPTPAPASPPAAQPTGTVAPPTPAAGREPLVAAPATRPASPPTATAVPVLAPPVAIKQNMPRWNPPDAMARDASSGAIRVQIDATGRVTGATMARPIHPLFDVLMVDAAKGWRYRPATRDGEPIPWESVVTIRVEPTVR